MTPSRPAPTAPDEEWFEWIESLLNIDPEEDPAIEKALAEAFDVLKQRAILDAGIALEFTDNEMLAVQALADQFYQGTWYDQLRELWLETNFSKPRDTGQCLTLKIARNGARVLVQSARILTAPWLPVELGNAYPFSEPFPVPRFNQPVCSMQYSLFSDSESKVRTRLDK